MRYCIVYQSFYILFLAELYHINVRVCVIRNSFLIKKFIFNYFCVFFVLSKRGNDLNALFKMILNYFKCLFISKIMLPL